jgi:L-2,4-diaminobutyrate transaminase
LKNIEILERERIVENAAETGRYLLESLNAMAQRHRSIGDVRGLGLIAAVELVSDRGAKTLFQADAKMQERLSRYLMDEALFLRVTDVIQIAPPLISTHADIDHLVGALNRAIGRFEVDVGMATP